MQDTGVIQGISQAPATVSFSAMSEKQQALADVILKDPAVESLSSFIGADGTNTTLNSGRFSINLKPLDQRDLSAADVIRRLQTKLADVQGVQLFMQPVQNITVDDRVSRTQYQYTLEDPDIDELNLWAGRFVDKLKQMPQLEDVATDQQLGGKAVMMTIDRVTASRMGIAPSTIDNTLYDAYGQRQINTLYTQLNQYHVILGGDAGVPGGPEQAAEPLCAVEWFVRRDRRGCVDFVCCFGVVFGWIECNDAGFKIHANFWSADAGVECAGDHAAGIKFCEWHDAVDLRYQFDDQQPRADGGVHPH